MNYGNSNVVITQCPRCNGSIDRHKINLIQSGPAAIKLAQQLQALLDKVDVRSTLKGFSLPKTQTMVGAAIVTFGKGGQKRKYVTSSGYGATMLSYIPSLGKDVTAITDKECIDNGKLLDIKNRKFVPIILPIPEAPDGAAPGWLPPGGVSYDLGNCAFPKLLTRIVQDSKTLGAAKSFEACEIMWRRPGKKVGQQSRAWSIHEPVPHCRTCMQAVPQMLCNCS